MGGLLGVCKGTVCSCWGVSIPKIGGGDHGVDFWGWYVMEDLRDHVLHFGVAILGSQRLPIGAKGPLPPAGPRK